MPGQLYAMKPLLHCRTAHTHSLSAQHADEQNHMVPSGDITGDRAVMWPPTACFALVWQADRDADDPPTFVATDRPAVY
jgi:hypothetical protein